MYNPLQFHISDKNQKLAHIEKFGFGFLTSASDCPEAPPVTTPLPMFVIDNCLYGHVSRANPHWQLFDGKRVAQAVFPGPHGYVSPLWYPDPEQSVPTWNYTLVCVTGAPRTVTEDTRISWIMDTLVTQYEGPDGWSTRAASAEFLTRQRRGIVAFEMPVDSLEGKAKLSQNKPPQDAATVAAKFRESGNTDLSDAMERLIP